MAQARFEDIAETFAFLDDWEERYRHVIELGRAMPAMPEALKVEATRVHGCASQVWIAPRLEGQGPQAVLHFAGDSDALIVRGLIAVLHALYDGLAVSEAAKVDATAEMARLGLESNLSAQRSNGLKSMIRRLRAVAEAAEKGEAIV
jgi:cysteine desulfuration protein SufE